ncbi:MAG: hypothetical protein WEC16_02285 [Anaerolineales bacterium]
MQATNLGVRRRSRTSPKATRAVPQAAHRRAAAFDNLQTAILRLASKPPARPGGFDRQELGTLVEQALDAYRQYMRTVDSQELAT